MNKIIFSVFTISILTISTNWGQLAPVEKGLQAITLDAIKAQLGFLASDWTEGRMAGEKGAYLSADYIASMLQLYGVKPGGDYIQTRNPSNNILERQRSYFQNFVLSKSSGGDEQILKVKSTDGKTVKTINFTPNVDFRINSTDPGMEIDAPVVFAGYGIINNKLKYNDFNKLDIKGKFVLRIAGLPKFMQELMDQATYSSTVSETDSELMSMGAIGIIEFHPMMKVIGNTERKDFEYMSPAEGNPRPGNSSYRYSIPAINSPNNLIRITISMKTANAILQGSGINPDDYMRKADANEPFVMPPLTNKAIFLKTTVNTSQIAVRNIIGIIEGKNPDQVIVLGAHYDHMGMSNGYIWNGADDNGSGTVGVMTLAKAIMDTGVKPEKTIILAFWTAEEKGLLGSRYYAQNLTYPVKNLSFYMNFDMISRYVTDDEPRQVTLTYTNTYPGIKDMTEANLKKYGIDLIVDYQGSPKPYGASDEGSFISEGIPIMRFKTVHREEYHTPYDEINTIDWDIMEKIIRISFSNVWELANRNN